MQEFSYSNLPRNAPFFDKCLQNLDEEYIKEINSIDGENNLGGWGYHIE